MPSLRSAALAAAEARVRPAPCAPRTAPPDAAALAARLWEHFRARGVRFRVLGAPEAGLGGDIDMAVGRPRGRALLREIDAFARAQGAVVVQALQHEWGAWYCVLAWPGADGAPRYLHIDICADYLRDGRRVLGADEMLAGADMARDAGAQGYPTPPPAVAFVYYLVKKVAKGALEPRHGAWLAATWRRDPAGARAALGRFWAEDDAALIAAAAESGDWRAVEDALPRLRRALAAALPYPLAARLREGLRRAARALRPSGLVVAALGPDGAGKTTLLDRLDAMLAPAFRRRARFHLRPGLIRAGKARPGAVDDPHGAPPRGIFASAAKAGLFVLDHALGYAVRVWPLKRRSTLALFDRHYHDLLADPARYRYGAPRWIAALGGRLVPRPDLWLVLDAPAAAIQARKREVSAAETARQREAYRALAQSLGPRAIVIDAAGPPDEVAAEAAWAALDALAARFARRIGRAPPPRHGRARA